MKQIAILAALSTFSFAQFEIEGNLGIKGSYFTNSKTNHSNNLTLEQKLKLTHNTDSFTNVLEVYAQEDTKDLNKNKKNNRSFIKINEIYTKYEADNWQVLLGKNIRFWGALEAKNITDVFNRQETRNDPFITDKNGEYNIEYSYYFDESELSIITKLYEQSNRFATNKYFYSILNDNENLSKNLNSEKSLYRPTIYLKYSGSIYDNFSLDYSFIYQNGYDSQRYLSRTLNEYKENIYLVDKFMTYNTAVINSTLVKLEAIYTNVKNDKNISDYIHLGLGFEHTLDPLESGHEVGIIGEYYYYKNLQDNKLNDLQLAQTFQDDIFLGLRYNFNDVEDSSLVTGIIHDRKYNEQAYYLEYETRLNDMFRIEFDYRYIEPSNSHNTVYKQLGQHQRALVNLTYHF